MLGNFLSMHGMYEEFLETTFYIGIVTLFYAIKSLACFTQKPTCTHETFKKKYKIPHRHQNMTLIGILPTHTTINFLFVLQTKKKIRYLIFLVLDLMLQKNNFKCSLLVSIISPRRYIFYSHGKP